MATPFPSTVELIINEEKVDSGIINRPLSQLSNRTLSNKEKIDAFVSRGAIITKADVDCEDAVLESQLVYWDSVDKKLKLAIAELTAAGAPPTFTPTARNFVVGVAQNIRGTPGAKFCDLLIRGHVPSVSTTNLVQSGETPVFGKPYYLTVLPAELGRMTSVQPGLRVYIGILQEDGGFFLDVDAQSLGEDHTHHQLVLDPDEWLDLGPSVVLTGVLTFTATSTTVTGVGTLFTTELAEGNILKLDADDYWVRIDSIISDTELILVKDYDSVGGAGAGTVGVGPWVYPGTMLDPWPAIPFESVTVVVNGSVMTYDLEYAADLDGIHWLDTDFPPSHNDFEAQIFYVFPLGRTAPGVTKLKEGTPNVKLENCSPGGPSDSGDLKLSVFNILEVLTTVQSGSGALKAMAVDPTDGDLLLKFGPVVEKLVAGPGVSLAPSGGQGIVTVTATGADALVQPLPEILLRNAKQSFTNITPYIELPEGVTAGFMAKVRLPAVFSTAEPLRIIFEMLGELSEATSATSAVFTLKYNIIDPATGESLTKATLPLTSTVPFPFPYVAFETFSATIFEIPASQLVPSATLSLLIERDDTGDVYAGNVGIVNPLYRIKLT